MKETPKAASTPKATKSATTNPTEQDDTGSETLVNQEHVISIEVSKSNVSIELMIGGQEGDIKKE